jgi:transglutaminase-like putative cysteine protease
MKVLLILLLFISPIRQVEYSRLQFSSPQHHIFPDYVNDNFSQKIKNHRHQVVAETQSLDFSQLDLNFIVILDQRYLFTLDSRLGTLARQLFREGITLKEYVSNLSRYLKENIRYSDRDSLQDSLSVLTRGQANCVGYSNLTHDLLKAVGVRSQLVKGFYLEARKRGRLNPIPHKWLEICLSDRCKFFYDPQHQSFSSTYMVVEKGVDFTRIKRFEVLLIEKEVKMLN